MRERIQIPVFIFTISLFITAMGNAQGVKDDAQENLFKLGGADATSGIVRKYDNRYQGVQGSPYYLDDWSAGRVTLKNGQSADYPRLKFDMYEDELILNQARSGTYYFPKDEIASFSLTETNTKITALFLSLPHFKKEGVQQFYRIHQGTSVRLLEYVKVIFEKANFEGGYSNEKRYDEFKKYPQLYVQQVDKVPVKLKTSAKGIIAAFPDHQEEIKKYLKLNSIDPKNLDDLKEVFTYYESL